MVRLIIGVVAFAGSGALTLLTCVGNVVGERTMMTVMLVGFATVVVAEVVACAWSTS